MPVIVFNPVRFWRSCSWLGLLIAALLILPIAPHLTDSAELTRLRNALLLDSTPATFDWTPSTIPSDFRTNHHPVDPLFAEAVQRHSLSAPDDDWETALRIGRHLLRAVGQPTAGGAIQSDLRDTYLRITERGEGYCGDFADVFTGLAAAAGLFSRPWAFSFEGFGGRGHIFNEVWDRRSGSWRMIDVFNNFYPVDSAGHALSAIELRTALERGTVVELVPIEPLVRPGFVQPERGIAYYRRGLREWYLWWGNNVFQYDANAFVRGLSGISRSLEQLAGIAAGVHPRIRVLQTPDNSVQLAKLQRLGTHLKILAVAIPITVLVTLLCVWRRRCVKRVVQCRR